MEPVFKNCSLTPLQFTIFYSGLMFLPSLPETKLCFAWPDLLCGRTDQLFLIGQRRPVSHPVSLLHVIIIRRYRTSPAQKNIYNICPICDNCSKRHKIHPIHQIHWLLLSFLHSEHVLRFFFELFWRQISFLGKPQKADQLISLTYLLLISCVETNKNRSSFSFWLCLYDLKYF